MCLLIHHSAKTEFDFADSADFYDKNSDGLGIMYAEGGVLHIKKMLPRSATEAHDWYEEHAKGRECVIHWRMRTHGHTDLENCHPYQVLGEDSGMPLYLAHNGILSTGNKKDISKSDTWHYINDYLRPLLQKYPDLAFDPIMVEMIGEHIGSSNKFIFLNADGQISVVNERVFVDYKGAKLSNTYAWSSHKGGYGNKGYSKSRGLDYDDDWMWGGFNQFGGYREGSKAAPAKAEGGKVLAVGKHGGKYDATPWMEDKSKTNVVPMTKTTEYMDAADFAMDFFTELKSGGYSDAFKDLSVDDMTDYYAIVGEEEAYQFLAEIEVGTHRGREIIGHVTATLLAAATKEAEAPKVVNSEK